MKRYLLEFTVFTTGAVVMILELSGSRVLGPYFGNSVYIWTSLIGIILGSLSIGYWWGGRLADKHPSFKFLSMIILGAAVCVGLITIGKEVVLQFIKQSIWDMRIAAVVATTVLFAPPGILLGMVSPYAVRLKMSGVKTSGQTVGNLYAISTVGSIVGTFLTGFLLLALMGITKLLFALALLLVLLSLVVYSGQYRAAKIGLALMFSAAAIVSHQKSLARAHNGFIDVDSDYSRIWVVDGFDPRVRRMTRSMMTDPYGGQSVVFIDDLDDLYADYMRFYRLANHFNTNMRRALTIGGAGYAQPRDFLRLNPNAKLDVVEIDPKFTQLAKKYFGLKEHPNLTIYHEDARTYLDRTTQRYDAVIVDAFQSTFTPPFQLSTVEAVRLYANVLSEDGVLLLNMVSSIEGDTGKFFRAQLATYKKVFPQVHVLAVMDKENSHAWQSLLLVASKSDKNLSFTSENPEYQRYLNQIWNAQVTDDMPILTDDYVPVEHLLLDAVASLERERVKTRARE